MTSRLDKSIGLARQIDAASLLAWPALEHLHYDGWRLGFSRGYTGRANSVTAIASGDRPLSEKISYAQEWYAARGHSALFRLASFSEPETLDAELERRGYSLREGALVRILDLRCVAPASPKTTFVESVDEWLAAWCNMRDAHREEHSTHGAILGTIPCDRLALAIKQDRRAPVACGMAVVDGSLAGIFDVVTAMPHRRQGHGAALIRSLLDHARRRGAMTAYLQVMPSNEAASRLYASLGFTTLYRYWYRVQP